MRLRLSALGPRRPGLILGLLGGIALCILGLWIGLTDRHAIARIAFVVGALIIAWTMWAGAVQDQASATSVATTGSLARRMIVIAAAWITLLLAGGGFALDRVLASAVTRNFDDQLEYVLKALIVSAEIGP